MPFTFNGVNAEEVFRRTISEASKSGRIIRLLSAHEPEAAAVSGLIAKVLKAGDIELELIMDSRGSMISEAQVISVGLPPSACKGCITIQRSGSNSFTRLGFNYVFKYRSLSKGVLDLVGEFELITKDFKLTLAAAMLTRYTPRLRKGGLGEGDTELIKELSDDGVIEVRKSIPIIGWEVIDHSRAVSESIDVLIPSLFLKPASKFEVDELAREVGLDPGSFKDNAYIVRSEWVSRDLHQAAYIIDWLTDTVGAEAVAASMLNQAHLKWGAVGMMSSLSELRSVIDNLRSYSELSIGNRRYIVIDDVDPHRFSATLARKSLASAGLIGVNDEVILKSEGLYYVPSSSLSHELRVKVIERGGSSDAGYITVKDPQLLT